jgi:hypothetical protein
VNLGKSVGNALRTSIQGNYASKSMCYIYHIYRKREGERVCRRKMNHVIWRSNHPTLVRWSLLLTVPIYFEPCVQLLWLIASITNSTYIGTVGCYGCAY